MRVLGFDKKEGVLTVSVENDDDLWHLFNIVTPGDTIVRAKTPRKIKKEFGDERTETEKVWITLSVKVEKADYHEYADALRISGTVVGDAPSSIPLGSHHTISVSPGSVITLIKSEWSVLDLERVRKAKTIEPKALVVLIDRDEAMLARMTASGLRTFLELHSHIPPKSETEQYEAAFRDFVANAASSIEREIREDPALPVIIAGPGNVKEMLETAVKSRNPDARLVVCNASSATQAAFTEILSSQAMKIVEESSARREVMEVEEVLKRISKDEPVSYGIDEVRRAIEARAAEKVLISDALVKEMRRKGAFGELELLLKDAEAKNGARIIMVSSGNPAGKQLEGLGGIAALLRYRI